MTDSNADAPVLEAYFCYDDYRDDDLDEMPCVRAPDDGDWAAFAEMAEENEDDIGTVVIRHGDHEVRIEDSLIATVQNVCLLAVPRLIAREHVVVRLFTTYGYVRMDPEGSDQLVLGDFIEPVRLPRVELIPALVGVGRTYLDYLEAVRSDDDEFTVTIDRVRGQLAAADEALAAWDGT